MKVVKYGPGGRDPDKPNNNVVTEYELPEPIDEEKARNESRRNPQKKT